MRGFVVVVCVWLVASASAAQVSGRVLDADGEPLAGATVTLRATETRAQTDADGAFVLDAPAGSGVVVGAARGYFYRGATVSAPATGVELRLDTVPTEDEPHALASATSCTGCHTTQASEWARSAMRHAGTNTWVHDLYDGSGTEGGEGSFVYTRDSVHREASPSSECAACHEPLLWATEPFAPLSHLDDASPSLTEGVTCTICHQMASVDLTRPNAPGLFPDVVRFARPTDGSPVMFGRLGDVDYVSAGAMRAAYLPTIGSEVCATCHQDANDPDHDHDFDEENSVISEPTYLEWLASDYADPESPSFATCADCHMRTTPEPRACNVSLPYERPEGQVRSHDIRGTTADYLENALTLALDAELRDGALHADVTLTNDLTGHHVPTGVTVRNVILLVEAFADGEPLTHTGEQVLDALAGVGDPAQGYYAGLPGKLYAKRNHAAAGPGTTPVFFTEAVGITSDNRLAAGASDRTTYRFALPPDDARIEVRARVIYRRAWRALVDGKGWTEDGHGRPLADVSGPHFGHLMEREIRTLDFVTPPDAGLDAGAGEQDAGSSIDAGTTATDDGGCGCRTLGEHGASSAWIAICTLLGMGVFRRRRNAPIA